MGSLARRARKRGVASSSSEVRSDWGTRRRLKRERAELHAQFRDRWTALPEAERSGWQVFADCAQEADDAIRAVVLGQSDVLEPVTLALPPRPLPPPIVVAERNEPAEQLRAIIEQSPWVAHCIAPTAIAPLVEAAREREEEIFRAREAAKLGAVVLADGGVVPQEESALVDGKWVRIPEPSTPPMRARSLLAIVAMLGASAGLPPRGAR